MIEIKVNVVITPKQIAAVYQEAEFDKSIENEMRLKKMLTETPLTISAWEKEQLIGFVRCLTDFEYFCYISDLVILPEYQGKKIGSRLLAEVQEYLGNRVLLTLRSEETAQGFYQKIGYEKTDAMFRIHRER
ncbi:GNAT family N-acetyltransferase [Enterococcus sp. JM9B]|uniref:GNAT family N-acetyltransferase n=1 Tax=Enterococcus sp. JM9B TaxID=1857216 RepID=UPI001374FDFD|nr:GNAT family N-acetyltransferase [Enterococcus sp. JM9B]KAF1302344.1 acetyltransferase [Enterococcus sp. JM9B]